jgi:hypothetical protein
MPTELVDEKPIWFRISNAAGVGMATCAREREAEETARMLQSLTGEVYTINRVTLCGDLNGKKSL